MNTEYYFCYLCKQSFSPEDLYVTTRDYKSVEICKSCSLATPTPPILQDITPKYNIKDVKPDQKTCVSCHKSFWGNHSSNTCLGCQQPSNPVEVNKLWWEYVTTPKQKEPEPQKSKIEVEVVQPSKRMFNIK